MKSGVWSLLARTLRDDTRRATPYFTRMAFVVVVLFFAVMSQAATSRGGAPGLALLGTIIWLNLFFIGIVCLSYFCSAITEEKEDGTLGLLRMTNLSPVSILLGKSIGRLAGAFFLILAQLPFTFLAVTLGGITLTQIITVYTALLAATFLLSNVSLFFSVICSRTNHAVSCTVFILTFIFIGIPLLDTFLVQEFNLAILSKLSKWCLGAFPFRTIFGALKTGFTGPILSYPIYAHVIAGVVFFILSWLVFDRFNQGEGKSASAPKARSLKLFASVKPRAWDWAVAWKEFYIHAGGPRKVIFTSVYLLIAALAIGILGSNELSGGSLWKMVFSTFGIVGLMGAAAKLATNASTMFKEEIQEKTLSSLVMQPKSVRRIAYEKVIGCLPGLIPYLVCIFLGALVVLSDSDVISSLDEFIPTLVYGLIWILFALHLIVYLSLFLRWGALPLGLFGCFVLWTFMTIALVGARMNPFSYMAMSGFFLLIATAGIHWAIGNRLITIAAEE